MKHLTPHWKQEDLENIIVEQAPNPSIGYSVEPGIDIDKYKHLVSAGVYRGLPNFFNKDILEKEFNWIDHKGYAIHKMLPGSILPLHRDKYAFYANHHNVTNFDTIVRVIVFLQDHKLGHTLQVEDCNIPQWNAGDYVYWKGKKAHLAANFGADIRYTLQITGLVK